MEYSSTLQLTPARGLKQKSHRGKDRDHPLQLTPARGLKLIFVRLGLCRLQLTPARGLKLESSYYLSDLFEVATHTREGIETLRISSLVIFKRCNSHPQGD